MLLNKGERIILTFEFLSVTLETKRCWNIFKEYQWEKTVISFVFQPKTFGAQKVCTWTFYKGLEKICLLNKNLIRKKIDWGR